MGVFEDVVINAKSAAETVGKRAGRLVDISKLRLNAAELSSEISKQYEALGRVVYNAVKNEGGSDDMGKEQTAHEYVESIDLLYRRLDEVNAKINSLQNKKVCPSCGSSNGEDATFCSCCGVKLSDMDDTASSEAASCEAADVDVPEA